MKTKKLLSLMLAICMLLSVVPMMGITASAASAGDTCPSCKTGTLAWVNVQGYHMLRCSNYDDSCYYYSEVHNTNNGVTNSACTICNPSSDSDTEKVVYGDDITFNQVLSSAGGTLTSGNYYLSGNITLTNGITIAEDATVNLNLAGNVLCGNGNETVIIVSKNATLNIYDYYTGTAKTHKFVVPTGKTGLWTWNESTGTETVTGGCITGGKASLIVTNGVNSNYSGGGISIVGGVLNFYGGTVCGNQAVSSNDVDMTQGGGIYVKNSAFTMYSGNICGNYAAANGGGISANNYSTVKIKKGCSVSYNKSNIGGGIFIDENSAFKIYGTEISYNTSVESGGGLYICSYGSNANELNNCTITGNKTEASSANGGGIYISGGANVDEYRIKLIINGGSITGNSNIGNGGKGGGIYVGTYSELELSKKVIVSGNTVRLYSVTQSDNVRMNSGGYISVGSTGLYYGSSVGIYKQGGGYFLKGGSLSEETLDRYAYYFPSDIANYGAQYISNDTQYGLTMVQGVTTQDPGDDGTGSLSNEEEEEQKGGILTFTALENSSIICLRKMGSPASINLSYSLDGGSTWQDYTINTSITLQKNKTIAFKGENSTFSTSSSNYYRFAMSGKFSASGSVTSLLDGKGTDSSIQLPDYCFYNLFSNLTSLTTAPELISTNLGAYCYYAMFAKCTSLTTTPELPATTLKNYCYTSMFYGCTGLTAPADMSHVTALASNCCGGMYSGCSNIILNTSKIYDDDAEWKTPNITMVYGWCNSMFANTSGSENSSVVLNKTYYIHVPKVSAVTNGTPEANKATNNGYISSLVTEAKDGTTVSITATPNTGYELDKITVYKTGTPATTVSVSNNQFTMPAYAVTVSATFKLSIEHVHSWTYGVSGATFTATCGGEGICDSTANSLSIVAPTDTYYSGNAKVCTLSATTLGEKTGISADSIKYYVKGESTEMSGNPTEIGTYVAKLTLDGAGTAELEFTIKASPVSLTIGSTTTWYTTIQGACDAAGTNTATVTLYKNMTENVTVNSGENLTIDLNGYVLKSAANEKAVILNNGTLTVKSTNTERKHYFTEGSNKLWTWNGDAATTDYVVTGGIITGGYSTSNDESKFGCGIRATSTLTLDHINIVGNTSTCGAGFRAKDDTGSSTYTMYDTVIAHNYSSGLCGGASLDSANGTFVMERCVVSDNYAVSNAGGIVVTGKLTMTDCTVSGNYSGGKGGGLRMAGTKADVTINGGSITDNTSAGIGGGIVIDGGIALTLGGNAVITGNTGEGKTENLYLPSGKTAAISNPGGKMNVGVTVATAPTDGNNVDITGANGADYSMYFSSDNTSYTVKNDSNTVKLVSTSKISTDVSGAGYSASLTLNENIDVNFKMGNLGDGFSVDKLSITVDGETVELKYANGVVTAILKSVSPEEMSNDLHIVVTYDNVQVKNFNYSVKSYCEAVFKAQTVDKALAAPTGKYDKLATLCEALLNYGKYAEDYANGNTDSTVNEGHEIVFGSEYEFTGLKDEKVVLGDYADEGSAAYLTLGSTIKLNFILKGCTEYLSTGYDENGEADIDNPQNFYVLNDKDTPEQIDPKRVTVTIDGTDTIVSIDLYASQLSTSYTLKLKGVDTSKFCITYGVYNYCSAAQSQTNEAFTDTLKTLCKAIHNYSEAVQEYIGQ